jgi:prepilin-type N-terminal cleavage/methylation domain-containing protein
MFKNRPFCLFETFKNRKGFTLTEVVVTLGILGIMTAISIPSFLSWLPRHKLQTSARQIYDDLNLAKMQAVRSNTVVVAIFTPATNQYSIFLDASVPLNWAYDGATDTYIRQSASLENGVSITGTTLTAHTCGFNNRGMLQTGAVPGVIQLTNPTGILMGVEVMNTAGGIRIVTSTDGWVSWS